MALRAPTETLLFVCTANVCRSPMAEAFARARLAGRPYGVAVASAGILGPGIGVPGDSLVAMGRYGLDLASHRSTSLPSALSPPPDLIVGMGRDHVRAVVETDPAQYFPRTYVLKDLVRRCLETGPRQQGQTLQQYLDVAARGRRMMDLVGISQKDDVADPMGRGPEAFRRCAAELSDLIDDLVDHLWPAEGA